jgi:hypothetical protein
LNHTRAVRCVLRVFRESLNRLQETEVKFIIMFHLLHINVDNLREIEVSR